MTHEEAIKPDPPVWFRIWFFNNDQSGCESLRRVWDANRKAFLEPIKLARTPIKNKRKTVIDPDFLLQDPRLNP